ncbi:MAG: hypothetical protein ACTSRS_00320 [Candidatus Helarchaeota archaeon]
MQDEFLLEMIANYMLEEFKDKDYTIFDQQIAGLHLSTSAFQVIITRLMQTKSPTFQHKIKFLLQEGRQELVERAFEIAKKRYKTKMTLRFIMFEQNEMGE